MPRIHDIVYEAVPAFGEGDGLGPRQVADATGLKISQVRAALARLELKGLVYPITRGKYERVWDPAE